MGLLFIDTETTGLDPEKDQLLEVAWATLEEPEPKTLVFRHDRNEVPKAAADINHYYERQLGNPKLWCTWEDEMEFQDQYLDGATLVGANIGFDESFLARKFMSKPWHYRKVDIESIAYHAFGYPEKVPGMKQIFEELTARGYDIPEPDHTAAGDVRALIASFNALKELQ